MESKRPEWWTELVPERDVNAPISIDEIIGDNIIAISATLPFYRGNEPMTKLLESDLDKWQDIDEMRKPLRNILNQIKENGNETY